MLKTGEFLLNCLFNIEHLFSLCLPDSGKHRKMLLQLDNGLMTVI